VSSAVFGALLFFLALPAYLILDDPTFGLSGDEFRILLMIKECIRSAEKETEIYVTRGQ
jgi:hypothetical protein